MRHIYLIIALLFAGSAAVAQSQSTPTHPSNATIHELEALPSVTPKRYDIVGSPAASALELNKVQSNKTTMWVDSSFIIAYYATEIDNRTQPSILFFANQIETSFADSATVPGDTTLGIRSAIMQFDEYVTADSTFYTKPDSVFLNQLAYYASYQNNGPADLVFRVLPLTQNISGGQVVTTVDTTLGNEYTADTLALTSVLGTPTTLPQQTQDLFLPINGVQGTGFAIEIQYFGGINDTFELGSFTYGEERATGGYYDYPLPFTQTYFDSTHNFVYDKSKTTGYIRFDTLVSSFDQVSIGGNPVPEFPSYDDLGRLERQWRWDLSMTTYTFITDKSEAEFVGEAAKIGNPYPNPTSPGNTVVLPIESFGNMDLDARVLSTTGQVMWQYNRENMDRGIHKLHIPTEDLASGVYLINVETGGQRTVKRLIVR